MEEKKENSERPKLLSTHSKIVLMTYTTLLAGVFIVNSIEAPTLIQNQEVIKTASQKIGENKATSTVKKARAWGNVSGILMFRGNPARTWYGESKVPASPALLWRYPARPMCGNSTVYGKTTQWCGTGWTGQPIIWERPDGITELIVGAYDHAVHFVDASTGLNLRPPFYTGDIIKGTGSIDPDGFPLFYIGSRDNYFRILALDTEVPKELWRLSAHPTGNNDWDGNPIIMRDMLIYGGEDGWFRIIKLNRHYDSAGKAAVTPSVLFETPTWTDELLAQVRDRNMFIESSVAVFGTRAYVTNSAGRVMGFDIARAEEGIVPVVFDFWAGDDIDATPVIDEHGMLYIAAELERFLPRALEVGQLIKLNPDAPENPLVWSVHIPARANDKGLPAETSLPANLSAKASASVGASASTGVRAGGAWATPALAEGVLYINTHGGNLLAVDAATGAILWDKLLAWHSWSSPLVVGDTLITPTCDGKIHAWDIKNPATPIEKWNIKIPSGSCIESTATLWNNTLYVGARDGYLYAFADKE